jgi:hypothetical protein
MARERPDVLRVFADRYRESQAGRTGAGSKDFMLDYRELLKAAGALEAESRIVAEERLRQAASESDSKLVLETHPRDDKLILLIRLVRDGGESWLFHHLKETSPTEERQALAALFAISRYALELDVWHDDWSSWCMRMAGHALKGDAVAPFSRSDLEASRELLGVLMRVLRWQGESLIRFASCTIAGDSKRLESLRPRIESALSQISNRRVQSLEDLGLMEKPRQVFIHGPLGLELPGGMLNVGLLTGPASLSETDIRAATRIHCEAARVLTVENETSFLELAKVNRDTLLIQTSYPNRAVLALLARLPAELPFHHFGDTDPAGFDILRDLRARSKRPVQPLHMRFRFGSDSEALSRADYQLIDRLLHDPLLADCAGELTFMKTSGCKGAFEQESLGLPSMDRWPFYG